MLVNKIMKIFQNFFRNSKLNADEIAIYNDNNKYSLLDKYLYEKLEVGNYSEQEKKIGKWIDGNNIYRKVVSFSAINNSIDTGISNLNELISISCLIKAKPDDSWRTLPWIFVLNNSIGDNSWAGGFFLRSDGIISFQTGSNISNISKGYCIIEYTKK